MVLVGVGMLIGATSLPDGLPPDVEDDSGAIDRSSRWWRGHVEIR
jgi:hypothetical protein